MHFEQHIVIRGRDSGTVEISSEKLGFSWQENTLNEEGLICVLVQL